MSAKFPAPASFFPLGLVSGLWKMGKTSTAEACFGSSCLKRRGLKMEEHTNLEDLNR